MLRSLVPWRERFPSAFPAFGNEMEEFVGKFLGNGGEEWGLVNFTPSVNVSETESGYEVAVELPGMKPEEVKVEWKDGRLWISGEKKEESEEQGKTFHRIERHYGEFRRTIPLPTEVAEEAVEAKFENGVLKVTVPKVEQAKPRRIPVKA